MHQLLALFQVLRTLLSKHSTVFREMLTSDVNVAATNSIVIESGDARCVMPFADYFHTQRINTDLNLYDTLHVLFLAITYKVQKLTKLAAEHVKTLLSMKTVHNILNQTAHRSDVDDLNRACLDLIYEHRQTYRATANFAKLSKPAQDLVIKECY